MLIRNQDNDCTYDVSKVWYKKHVRHGIMWGYNIYGRTWYGRKVLLGTRDTEEEAAQIVAEIRLLKRKKVEFYSIPELVDDCEVEILIDSIGGFGERTINQGGVSHAGTQVDTWHEAFTCIYATQPLQLEVLAIDTGGACDCSQAHNTDKSYQPGKEES